MEDLVKYAIITKDADLIVYLYKLRNDINQMYELQQFAYMVCDKNNLDIVKKIIHIYDDETKLDCLKIACTNGNYDIVKYISTIYKIDVNVGLLYAANGGSIELMQYFIDNGATNIGQCMKVIEPIQFAIHSIINNSRKKQVKIL